MYNFPGDGRYDKKIPQDYTHLMDQEQYERMIGIVFNYFKDRGDRIVGLEDGTLIVMAEETKDLKYGFDNLVRMLAGADYDDWESIIYSHFNKINYSQDAYNYYLQSFEDSKPFLKLLVKHESIRTSELTKDLVARCDFPETLTVLAFDYEGQFRYLKQEDVSGWNLPPERLFEEALNNVSLEEVSVNKMEHDDGWEFYSFFSGDFSASRMIELDKYFDFAVGQFGSLVALPTKGSTFVSPLNDRLVAERIQVLAPLVNQFFEQDPGNISNNFYWYYQGIFEKFPTKSNGDGLVTIKLPRSLMELLEANE